MKKKNLIIVVAMLIVALVFMGCPNVPNGTIIVNGIDISTGLPYEEPGNGGENIESGEDVTEEDDNGSGEEETVEETPTEQLYRFGNEYITLTQFEQFLAENTWITEDDYGENVATNLYVYATADGVPENYSDYDIHLTTNLDEVVVSNDAIIVPETHTF